MRGEPPLKIAHFGPPGLLADALACCFANIGYEFLGFAPGSGLKPEPSDLAVADIILLWVAPQPPSLSVLDDMHAILVLLEQAERSAQPKRIILVSNLLTWGSCPLLGSDEARAKISEDNYLKRLCWPSCEGLMALEAHVIRLDGPELYTCVVAAGLVYGAGEENLFKIMRDAYNFVTPLVLPSAGQNVIPTIHVGVLCSFLCWLIDLHGQRFTKQYMLACEPEAATLRDIAGAIIDEWCTRATSGAFASRSTNVQDEVAATSYEAGDTAEGITTSGDRADDDTKALHLDDHGGNDSVIRTDLRSFNGLLEGCEISFGYPESIMLALDCAGIEFTGGIFERAMNTEKIRPFMSKDGTHHGLVGNISEVIDEFVMVRGLTPYHIWVLRQPGDSPELRAAAKFISQRLRLPCIDAESSIKWLFAQPRRVPTYSAVGNSEVSEQQHSRTDIGAAPIVTPGSMTPVGELSAMSQYQKEIWVLQSEINCNINADTPPPLASTLPPKLVAKCVRLQLLDPFVVTHGYVLDACPASPVMFKDIFEDATSSSSSAREDVQSPIRVAAALAPSHVVVLSASVGFAPQASPELKQWTATEALDWRFGGDTTRLGDTKAMVPALEELFCGSVQPLMIPLSDFLNIADENSADLDYVASLPQNHQNYGGQNEEMPWWHITDMKTYTPDILMPSLPPNTRWKHAIVNLLEGKSMHGHFNMPQPESMPATELSETLVTQMSGPAPAPVETGELLQENEARRDLCKRTYVAPAHRNQFDDISQEDYEELHHRSTILRDFLMNNVMTHLTKAMLDVVCLPKAEDKIARLADMLAAEARRVEERADAYAYLRYRSSLARLNELRLEETDEDSCEGAEDVAITTLQ